MSSTAASPGLPLTAADAVQEREYDWNPRHIRWIDVLRYQHYGGLLILIPAAVITGVSHWTFQDHPVERQALLYDATISYPISEVESIPNTTAVMYNWLCIAVAVVVIELLLFRKQHSLTVGIAGLLHQMWCCAISWVVVIAVVEITKPFSGRLRPDFIARCQPMELVNASFTGDMFSSTLGSGLSEATLGPVHLGQTVGKCTNPSLETVKQGRFSFPSGHASNSMALAWYTAIYVVWSMYLRHDAPYPGRLRAGRTHESVMHYIFKRIIQEVWHALVYFFVLLALCLSWFIGITRFWDNVHNVDDILGGFLVAIIFTTPFTIKAIGLHGCLKHLIDDCPAAVHHRAGGAGSTPVQPTQGGVYRGAGGQRKRDQQQPLTDDHLALDVGRVPVGAHSQA